jgi:hypothetical protein
MKSDIAICNDAIFMFVVDIAPVFVKRSHYQRMLQIKALDLGLDKARQIGRAGIFILVAGGCKGPRALLWTGSRSARVTFTITGITNSLNLKKEKFIYILTA